MRTPKHFFSIALIATAATACLDIAAPAAVVGDNVATAFGIADVQRPFSGRFVGELTAVSPFAPGSSETCNQNFSGDPAAPGPSVSLFDEAKGNVTHLGSVSLSALSCVDPLSPTSAGTGTITVANGDQLFIAFENTSQPDPTNPARLLAEGPQWVTGGTGRFENASGRQRCSFVIVLLTASTGKIEGRCDGHLTYEG
jgi:hypothetical protein